MQTQCLLSIGDIHQTAWIPSHAAKVGNKVELKEDGLFWRVDKVYSTMSDEAVKEQSKQHRDHRKGTDI